MQFIDAENLRYASWYSDCIITNNTDTHYYLNLQTTSKQRTPVSNFHRTLGLDWAEPGNRPVVSYLVSGNHFKNLK